MTASQIIEKYLAFFEARGHKRIPGAPLVPENDPTTLFISSGMQPLVPYLLGEPHPKGTRLVDVQNVFRAVDIEEVGDDRHTTFYRMIGNWSLGDYFKTEQIPWIWEFLTKELSIEPKKLFVTVFAGNEDVDKDEESINIWKELFASVGIDAKEGERIFPYGVEKNWWSRSGTPAQMPQGEPGGTDTEIFYDFGPELKLHENSLWKDNSCHVNCDCGRYWEICNSVFMQYKKQPDGTLAPLPKPNVDFGGGLERLIGATENQPDMFLTSLFKPTITAIERLTEKQYGNHKKSMQIVADHLGGGMAMIAAGIFPSNKERGYILRRLLRRSFDHLWELKKQLDITPILETITQQYKETDPQLVEKFEQIKLTILTEQQAYERTLDNAKKLIEKELKKTSLALAGIKEGDELMGVVEISAETAFKAMSSFGLSPTQLKSLGYTFDEEAFAQKMEQHQSLSRTASAGKFKGGLADAQELTVKGHTATHLLQQAIRDMLGTHVHQTGSNITTERLRFDFNYDKKLTNEQIQVLEQTVREKITEDLPVHFEMLSLEKAKEIGAIGLFDSKYSDTVKVYIIGGSGKDGDYHAYSKEFCGGPHVPHTGVIQSFTITKQESIGKGQQRLYAVVS